MVRTVVTKTRRITGGGAQEFAFEKDMIPNRGNGSAYVRKYREDAWKAYQDLAMPTLSDEPWRRTDIRKLRAAAFHQPVNGNGDRKKFPAVPNELLEPLVGNQHAGQIILAPGRTQSNLDPMLAEQGVIFTDLVTAERQHPDVLEIPSDNSSTKPYSSHS